MWWWTLPNSATLQFSLDITKALHTSQNLSLLFIYKYLVLTSNRIKKKKKKKKHHQELYAIPVFKQSWRNIRKQLHFHYMDHQWKIKIFYQHPGISHISTVRYIKMGSMGKKYEKLGRGRGPFFFFFFFFFFSLFTFWNKFVLGQPKWKFSTRKKHFTPVGKIGKNDFTPSEKYCSYATVLHTYQETLNTVVSRV